MNLEYIPYTYLIGWSTLNKWYYGVEYGFKKKPYAHPNNLWTTYFTSSLIVKYFREQYGDPDVVKIRKTFSSGTIEERMENSINWEKKVLSKINISDEKWINGRIGGNVTPLANKKIARIRYNVDNVFQSEEIKQKIKETMMMKYGVDHPSKSLEITEKKKKTNTEKYGVSCNLQIPEIIEKAKIGVKSEKTKIKRKNTNIEKYGTEYISQTEHVKLKVLQSKEKQSNRKIVKLIREYKRVFNITLTSGWYQKSTDELNLILVEIQQIFGIYSYDDIVKIKVDKKYSNSIKQLQERYIVQKIKKYTQKFGRKLKLGRNWYRKEDSYLEELLSNIILQYGVID